MIEYKKMAGPDGIPIYFQKLPEVIRSVASTWTIFTGGADDTSVGMPGVHHWLEHVPFRGTLRYPLGYTQTKGSFVNCRGITGAYTNRFQTCYWSFVPKEVWEESFSIITDLVGQPLLTVEGIEAEREIIKQEIVQGDSDIIRYTSKQLFKDLLSGHPFEQPVLGTIDSLSSMSPDHVRKAHKFGYARSRAACFIAGNLEEQEVIDVVAKEAVHIPNTSLSERRGAANHGNLPFRFKNMGVTRVSIPFRSSVVYYLLPIRTEGEDPLGCFFRWHFIKCLFMTGQASSPLYRILRQERNLVYQTNTEWIHTPFNGYFGFSGKCYSKNIQSVIEAFRDVLMCDEVTSPERVKLVKESILSTDMDLIDPQRFNETAVNRLITSTKCFSDDELEAFVRSITVEDVRDWMDEVRELSRQVFVFEGK